ncbi:MAG: hypothetical protein [Wendovervirus sonii]|uniref:N-acetyltransferase domain-containing protein n=1 Tax=phage Lak_Megaphage_Sonny TaxID=3109229 RepID=A0ABZ0Z3S7_9CAUD|nr:MAG: hypothetical protein [phage Lak_Megaphage_Sonny]
MMEKVQLYEFENEQAFEDCLIQSDFVNWPYFQETLIMYPHKTLGIFENGKLVSAAKVHKDKSDILIIDAIETRMDMRRKGYGKYLINLIKENYACNSMCVKWTDETLKFWVNLQFQFNYDFNCMVR